MTKNSDSSRKALGKGLSALLPSRSASHATALASVPEATAAAAQPANGVLQLAIDDIQPNPEQPRIHFQPERLNELAQSIRSSGIIQPLIVQQTKTGYHLIAGERRWRAARLAGLATVPVVVQDIAADRLLETALIENIQREDLNPIEIAQALERLGREHQLSHEEIGQRTGKDRSTVSNLLRLLKLPTEVQRMVAEQQLTMGHARALIALGTAEEQLEAANKAVQLGSSVREMERQAQAKAARRSQPGSPAPARIDPNTAAAIRELENTLGTKVRIVAQSDKKGRIEIEYYSSDDLDRIYTQIVGSNS